MRQQQYLSEFLLNNIAILTVKKTIALVSRVETAVCSLDCRKLIIFMFMEHDNDRGTSINKLDSESANKA